VKTWPKTFVVSASALVCLACGDPPREEAPAPPPAPSSRLAVRDAWARPADSGAMTAVYFTVENTAPVPDTLNGVTSDAAELVGLHMSMQHEGTMHMAELSALAVPAEDSLLFRPMGAHVMLTRLTRPLMEGDTVAVRLGFVSGKSIEVRAGVRKP